MQNIVKTRKELESQISDESLPAETRAKAQALLDDGDFLEEGCTITVKSIRQSIEKHKETLDWLAKN